MKWKSLPPVQAIEFLKAVSNTEAAFLFQQNMCDVYETPMSFYDGYSLYRIVHKHMVPNLLIDFFSDGENHYRLDGSDSPFQTLNAQGALSINEHNVMRYLEFFISYVYERGNSFEFCPYRDNDRDMQLLLIDIEKELYEIEAHLMYQGALNKCKVIVYNTGAIEFKRPIEVSFLKNPSLKKGCGVFHPDEAKIIDQAKTILSTTKKGQKFIRILEENKIKIRVINSANYQGLTTPNNTIYITMPAIEQNAKYTQAIILGCHAREVDQNINGFKRPDPTIDREVYLNLNYGKNLDIIAEVCIMVEEYERANKVEVVDEICAMGLGPVYQGHKEGKSLEELTAIYLNTVIGR